MVKGEHGLCSILNSTQKKNSMYYGSQLLYCMREKLLYNYMEFFFLCTIYDLISEIMVKSFLLIFFLFYLIIVRCPIHEENERLNDYSDESDED